MQTLDQWLETGKCTLARSKIETDATNHFHFCYESDPKTKPEPRRPAQATRTKACSGDQEGQESPDQSRFALRQRSSLSRGFGWIRPDFLICLHSQNACVNFSFQKKNSYFLSKTRANLRNSTDSSKILPKQFTVSRLFLFPFFHWLSEAFLRLKLIFRQVFEKKACVWEAVRR